MNTKICPKCNVEKPVELFSKNKSKKDGLDNYCKLCKKQIYIKNREKRLEYQRNYKKEDEERFKQQQKRSRAKNKQRVYDENRRYQEKNAEKLSEYRRNYFEKNKERILERNRNYIKERRRNDDLFLFKDKARNLIKMSFRRKGFDKNHKTTEILGCGFEEFQKHLYNTFLKNYGYEFNGEDLAHIDHIIPLKTAKTEEDVIRLCHYTNLQLLKASDNLKKSAKM